MRHNLHMFQLNGYKNDEHISWIKKNLRQQWLLWFGLLLGIIRICAVSWGIDVLIYLDLSLIILVYRALRRLNNKKKLVFTPRVKRMIATDVTLSLLIVLAVVISTGIDRISAVCVILVWSQLFMDIVANIINHPMESAINRYYINDAKRMLKGMPELKIIGITGSFGKTSVKYYLNTLLQGKYSVLVTPGNFNTPLGITRTIREHLKPSHEIFLCEMGARRVGEIKEICDLVHPHLGVITSIGPQHLDTFKSIENIQKTKFELADALPNDGMLFLNGDNNYIREKASQYTVKTFYNSNDSEDGYYAKDISVSRYGTDFTVVSPSGEREHYQTKLIGGHNVINVVGAISVANYLGIPLCELRIPVRRIQPVEHRMQIKDHGNFTIIDDAYNSNPVGSKAAVETLAMFDGIRILVTPGMVELGEKESEYNYNLGTYASDCCDYILLVGKKHSDSIKKGALDKGFPSDKCISFDKLEDALSFAYAIKGQEHKYILLENDLPDNY
ncbi:MAG: UDP-N-acetylmuramoyl-tripeptide--D-alanyl-D-alanine ligase [Lachnospiraceae bacterium]|nr:UDP-N-acetylmuramoyl-tripeptide--D-alanyl-D-alanine ligase [Lachnospiraceae bacterium]